MNNLTNTVFYLFASPLQLVLGLILLPFAYNSGQANLNAPFVFLEFRELQDKLRETEMFDGPDHPNTLAVKNEIRQYARKCVKEKLWNKDDIRMYLNLGLITHLDLKGLRYNA